MKNYKITKLFFGQGLTNFYNAISQAKLRLSDLLNEKLNQHLFFLKARVDKFPSYDFGAQVRQVLNLHTAYIGLLEIEEEEFIEDPETFLKEKLVGCLKRGKFYPQMFRDFGRYYPKYNVPFDNIECVYLDFGSQLPKVIDSLLNELMIREVPLREEIPVDSQIAALEATGMFVVMNDKATLPPNLESQISDEEMKQHIYDYLAGEDKEKVFLQVIKFYLNSRLDIKNECLSILKIRGLSLDEESLVRFFLVEYIFQGVSNEAKRFFVANLDLNEKDPFSRARAVNAKKGANFSEKEKANNLRSSKESLEEGRARVNEKNRLTVAERQALFEEQRKKIHATDFNSLPRVSLSELMKRQAEDSDKGLG